MGRSAFFAGCGRARTENKWSGFLCADHSDEPLKAKIVEASAEHDFRPKWLIGMVSTTESVGVILYPCPITTLNCEPSLPHHNN